MARGEILGNAEWRAATVGENGPVSSVSKIHNRVEHNGM